MDRPILIGDIGSTKSTWWFRTDKDHELHLQGFNPVAHAPAQGKALFEQLRSETSGIDFEAVWYYGAGIIDHHTRGIVQESGLHYFPEVTFHIQSDLTGAAVAACGHDEGVLIILGTGSHAAIWDGHKITRQATSLGYILGDEGGGCDIGKALLQAYFYQEMPEVIAAEITALLPDGRTQMLQELQHSEVPNQYLASFAKVAVSFQQHEWIKALVADRIRLFIDRHLLPLKPEHDIHIVGSIGCIFAGLIGHELSLHRLSVGVLIRDPSRRLFERHMDYGRNEE